MQMQDITFGQILGVFPILGFRVVVPSWMADFTMAWVGDDTWVRKSSVFFSLIDIPGGNYLLKRIITGDGSKGSWFDRGWLNYRNGSRLAVGYTVFPK
jgi:hypothetical protein